MTLGLSCAQRELTRCVWSIVSFNVDRKLGRDRRHRNIKIYYIWLMTQRLVLTIQMAGIRVFTIFWISWRILEYPQGPGPSKNPLFLICHLDPLSPFFAARPGPLRARAPGKYPGFPPLTRALLKWRIGWIWSKYKRDFYSSKKS